MAAPSNSEQLLLELINETRLDPLRSANRYITSYSPLTSSNTDVQNALSFFGVNGTALFNAFSVLVPVQPLAWNNLIEDAANGHNNAMIAGNSQSHQLPGEPDLGVRLTNAGYTGFSSAAENIFAFAKSPLEAHAAFMVDWGGGPDGMQSPPGHRDNIMDGSLREIGVAISSDPLPGVGPLLVTEDFGVRFGGPAVFVLGVAYNDTVNDDFYGVGEGLGTLSVSGPGASTSSASSGGYVLGIGAGAATLTYSGAGLAGPVTLTGNFAAGTNAKIDVVDGTTLLTSASLTVAGPISRIQALGLAGLTLTGDGGSQTFIGSRVGGDILNGAGGGDTFLARTSDGNDTITGGAGFDVLDFSAVGGVVQINQFAGTVTGSAGNDVLTDVIEQILGSNFGDVLAGGHGINVLDGNGGNDLLFGNGGQDLLRGGNDQDTIFGQTSDGNDTLSGGNGFDVLDYSLAGGAVQVNQLAGTTSGTAGNDSLLDVFEQVTGSSFGDVLAGGHGPNGLIGNGGADQLFANNGNDYTRGGDGNDTITMGIGDDTHDFRAGEDVDTILDFVAGGTDDQIDLHFYGGLGLTSFAQLQASGRLTTVSGHAEIALNGGDRIIFQNVASHLSLTAGDFVF